MKGRFLRPPVFLNSATYAVDADGTLHSLSLRKGAAARTLCKMHAGAGANQTALVSVQPASGAQPGWTFLGISRGAVQAFSLATGKLATLYEAPSDREFCVNDAGLSAPFRGLVANGDLYALIEKSGMDQVGLVLRRFSPDHPTERLLFLDGETAMGPVLCEDALLFCSATAVGLYDLRNRVPQTLMLPPEFEPLLSRKAHGLNVPSGSIPLTVVRTVEQMEAWIGGEQYGTPGFMVVSFGGQKSPRFEPVPRGATISSNCDGTLCVATEGEVKIVGRPGWDRQAQRLQPGLPATLEGQYLFSFAREDWDGHHRLMLSTFGQPEIACFTFDDRDCNAGSCCGSSISGSDLLISYFGPEGLTYARWDLGLN